MACRHPAEIEAKLGEGTVAGATVEESARALGGRLVVTVGDPDGYVVGLLRDGQEVVNG